MWFGYHLWLNLTMSLVFWAKVYLTLRKKRLTIKEKWLDLAFDLTFAIIFSIAFIDLFFTIPQILHLQQLIRGLMI